MQFTTILHGLLDHTGLSNIDHLVGSLPLGGKLILACLILDLPKDEVTYDQCPFPHPVVMVASEALLISGCSD